MQITYSQDGLTATVTNSCPLCLKPAIVELVPVAGLKAWDQGKGEYIQAAFPDMSAGDREMILTGVHDACWNAAFGEEE